MEKCLDYPYDRLISSDDYMIGYVLELLNMYDNFKMFCNTNYEIITWWDN